ncbi:MAG TPA: amidase family protein, partial [Bryobacteraceae bacterium]|nr:amidase family protein [Bryobacteraceae bacterium]
MPPLTRRSFTLTALGALALRGQGSENLADLTVAEASARIHARSVTSTQLTEACLTRIETYNPKLNAFITVLREHALQQARDLDREQAAGKLRSPLHGIPIAL